MTVPTDGILKDKKRNTCHNFLKRTKKPGEVKPAESFILKLFK